ncbi:uncharacterized protein LOC113519925 [Galleria mellonella]|uniref:Uncharacterized protein LOC113519925 n=1 Tax=Galleria mellonella TaxID=7137 RepID=A0A6J1X4H4_GALME|nr:uncharacterized protein LOC113519925 [Galleria mellonella]
MEEKPVDFIRESTRNLLKLNRRIQREEDSDVYRSVDSLNLTSEQLCDIANRLKTKSSVTTAELHKLKNVLIDDKKNIDQVLSIQGALKGLVRELSGNDVKRQCAAAGCCSNLALGDSRGCIAVTKAAGPYLVAALGNLTTELTVTSAWAVGNLAGSGVRPCQLLRAQGGLAKLIALLHGNEDVRDAALYALVHFGYHLKDDLSVDHVEAMVEALSTLEISMASSHLLFILSCHKYFDDKPLPWLLVSKMIDAVVSIINCNSSKEKQHQLVYLIRCLANTASVAYKCDIRNRLANFNEYLHKLLESEDKFITESLLWLLSVLYNND